MEITNAAKQVSAYLLTFPNLHTFSTLPILLALPKILNCSCFQYFLSFTFHALPMFLTLPLFFYTAYVPYTDHTFHIFHISHIPQVRHILHPLSPTQNAYTQIKPIIFYTLLDPTWFNYFMQTSWKHAT